MDAVYTIATPNFILLHTHIITKTKSIPIAISTDPAINNWIFPNWAKLIGIDSEIVTPEPYKINKIPTPTKMIYIITKEE